MKSQVLLFVLGIVFVATSTHAEQAAGSGPNVRNELFKYNAGPSLFPVTGTECPAGSSKYHGPEQAAIAKTGMTYCLFVRKVTVLPTSISKTCPEPLSPYKQDGIKPDDGFIWCEGDVRKPLEAPPAKAK